MGREFIINLNVDYAYMSELIMNDSFYHILNQKMEKIKETLYNLGIDTLALLMKVALFISLPIKFIQFWREEWRNNSKGKTYDKQKSKR